MCHRDVNGGGMQVQLNGVVLEEVSVFKYLGSHVSCDGGMMIEVCYRVQEGAIVMGAASRVFRVKEVSLNVKRCVCMSEW